MHRGNAGWNMHGGYTEHGGYGDQRGYTNYLEQNPGFGGGYGNDAGPSSAQSYASTHSYRGQAFGYGEDEFVYNDPMNLSAIQEEQNMLRNKLAMANNLLKQQTQLLEEVGMQVTGFDRGGRRRRGRVLLGDGPVGYMGQGYGGKRSGSAGFGYDSKRQRMEMSYGPRGGRGKDRGRDGGRSRNQFRKDSRVKTVQKKKNKENKAETTPNDGPREPYDPTRNSVSYCHVCCFDFLNLKNWKAHCEKEEHKSRMAELESAKQEEHSAEVQELLEKIAHQTDLRENQSWLYCDTCDRDTISSMSKHKGSPQHEFKAARCKKGCRWCDIQSFKNFTELLEHRASEQHIKERIRHTGKHDLTIPEEALEYELEDLPTYQSGKQIGSEYIVPVTGYLCKLCQKYYPNLKSAKQDHCNSHDHYANYKKARTQSLKDNIRNWAMKARFCFKDGEENRIMSGREYEEYHLKLNDIDYEKLEQEVNEEKRLEEEERKREEEEAEKLRLELEAAKRLMAINGTEPETKEEEKSKEEEDTMNGEEEEDMEAQDEDAVNDN